MADKATIADTYTMSESLTKRDLDLLGQPILMVELTSFLNTRTLLRELTRFGSTPWNTSSNKTKIASSLTQKYTVFFSKDNLFKRC